MESKVTKSGPRKAKTLRVKRGLHELREIYQSINGFSANTVGSKNTTYGELSVPGIQALTDIFKRFAPLSSFDKTRRNFIDLGSGIGKGVIGVAMLVPEIQSNGIEIVSERHEMALSARKRIPTNTLANRIHFRNGNFLEPPHVFKNACWIFISNLSFSDELQSSLSSLLGSDCMNKTVIICCRELPLGQNFECIERGLIIPMSWSSMSTCYVYRRI
uniref:DOT1 domain-containing protein n=1 Tax=viral metagenome TaxID=1070528 RepID=A0A6C0K562_9ZZZZ